MTSSRLPSVRGVAVVEPHVLRLLFDDGVVRDIRFVPGEGGGSLMVALDDPGYFALVRVDPEAGTVVWPNGFDLAPEVLHDGIDPEQSLGFHDVTVAARRSA